MATFLPLSSSSKLIFHYYFTVIIIINFQQHVSCLKGNINSNNVIIQNLGSNRNQNNQNDNNQKSDFWIVSNENKSITIKDPNLVIVPGSIYSDLQRAHILSINDTNKVSNNLYQDFNDITTRWVAYQNWTYERSFVVKPECANKENIYLIAHGLDTVASVYLNDHLLLLNELVGGISSAGNSAEIDNQTGVDNMFIRYRWNVKHLLKGLESKSNQQQNHLRIVFTSPTLAANQRATLRENSKSEFNYPIPPECVPSVQKGECHVNLIRKMQASFSWDWVCLDFSNYSSINFIITGSSLSYTRHLASNRVGSIQ